jgi:uncharacterized protein
MFLGLDLFSALDHELASFILVGFLAQVVDGALGMAYGVTCATFLLNLGLPAASVSASIHAAEVFTTGVSGLSHLRMGNVDKAIFGRLLFPGVLGGILGAYVLTNTPDGIIKVAVAGYLLALGGLITLKALRRRTRDAGETRLVPLGFAGGFLDAIGGGGWGPIVTSTLLARGHNPRLTIGSVNAAEFFLTAAQTATFVALLGLVQWRAILGLMLGGVIAAPLAAHVCRKLPARPLMFLVGALIIALSARTLAQSLW